MSRPVSSASPASGSAMAARRVSSTWVATAVLIGWPRSLASARACRVSAAISCRRWTSRAFSWSPARFSCASRSRLPSSTRPSISARCSRTSRLHAQAAADGFGSAPIVLGQRLVAVGLGLVLARLPQVDEVLRRDRVQLVGHLVEIHERPSPPFRVAQRRLVGDPQAASPSTWHGVRARRGQPLRRAAGGQRLDGGWMPAVLPQQQAAAGTRLVGRRQQVPSPATADSSASVCPSRSGRASPVTV